MKSSKLEEANRIGELKRYQILDATFEPEFDELTALAAALCKMPMAAITLVDSNRQYFKSSIGIGLTETARDLAFCAHTIRSNVPFIIPDAQLDLRFRENPLVTGQEHLRFYAGVPIISPRGYALGAFAVLDHVPRSLDAAQIHLLGHLANQVIEKLNLRLSSLESEKLGLERDKAIAEKISAKAECELAYGRLSVMLDDISDTVFMLDHDWCFTYVNRVGELLGRRPRAELIGKKIWDEFPSIVGTMFGREFQRSVSEQVNLEFESFYDEGKIWLDARIYPSKDGLSIYLRDITDRKHVSESSARAHRALQLISRSNETLIRADREDELLEQVCQIAVDVGNYAVAWVGLARHDADQTIEVVAHVGAQNAAEYFTDIKLSWSDSVPIGRGPAGRTIRGGEIIICEDFDQQEGFSVWSDRARKFGFRGGIFLPLIDKGKTFGFLGLYSSQVLNIAPEESSLLQDFARDLAFGIVTIRARQQQQQIQQAVRQQAALLDQASDSIVVLDADYLVTYWNKGAERLYGWNQEEAIGKSLITLTSEYPETLEAALRVVNRSNKWSGETTRRRKDGSSITAECRWTLVNKSENYATSILAIDTDISQRKEAENEIRHLAFYDQLTDLPNRQHFMRLLESALKICNRTKEIGAVLFIDLDHFKAINDSFGHDQGDLVLKEVATRLTSCIRETDTVARLGGDEFLIILDSLGKDSPSACVHIEELSQRLLVSLSTPLRFAEFEFFGSASIGVALIDNEHPSAEEVMKQADLAMYQSKNAGGNMVQFFDPVMQKRITDRLQMEKELREAIHGEQLQLHYQPQIDHLGRVIGSEALIRWQHPVRGIVMPSEFIVVAEETGLILELGLWVLEAACQQLVRWARNPRSEALTLSVNVSVIQFRHPDFIEKFSSVITNSGVNPSRLKLEITESVFANNIESIISKMAILKAIGIGFSLDDFGTGYSSLSYLRKMPLDQLKVDRAFVQDALTDPNAAAITRIIIVLGQSLGLAVIAEGVETIEQRNFLEKNGCLAYQGYLYSRPIAIDDFDRLFATGVATIHKGSANIVTTIE